MGKAILISPLYRRIVLSVKKITPLTLIPLIWQKSTNKTQANLENLTCIHKYAHMDIPKLLQRGLHLREDKDQNYHLISPNSERWMMKIF